MRSTWNTKKFFAFTKIFSFSSNSLYLRYVKGFSLTLYSLVPDAVILNLQCKINSNIYIYILVGYLFTHQKLKIIITIKTINDLLRRSNEKNILKNKEKIINTFA